MNASALKYLKFLSVLKIIRHKAIKGIKKITLDLSKFKAEFDAFIDELPKDSIIK